MNGFGIGDVTWGTVEYALRGLTARADVRAHNLANVNTPNFRAQRVDFESSLADALRTGDLAGARGFETTADPNLPGPNGNTVSSEGELVGQMKDNLLRSAMINSLNFKAQAMRSAIGRR